MPASDRLAQAAARYSVIRLGLLAVGLLVWLFFGIATVQAHEQRPALIDIEIGQADANQPQSAVQIRASVKLYLEAVIAGIDRKHRDTDDSPQAAEYNRLRALPPGQLEQAFVGVEDEFVRALRLEAEPAKAAVEWEVDALSIPDVGDTRIARLSVVRLSAALPVSATGLSARLGDRIGDGVVRFKTLGEEGKSSHWLKDGASTPVYPLRPVADSNSGAASAAPGTQAGPTTDGAWDYLKLGFYHIVPAGLDHILFVLGLFFLAFRWRALLWQITAFTVAHSITLGLSLYGVVSLSPAIVEPLIALSIAYVGIENLFTRELKPWRPAVVFAFGLLHGIGFAGILHELELPESDYLTALISFNVGVEFGQIAVVLTALLIVGWWGRDAQRYRRLVTIPGSLMVSLAGLAWLFDRLN